ncbi:MAG: 5-formyltetrahydrofolate cyclo-ligase [Candidatus Omnitrophica bacterium]|nr:5-formyltetrahydrofolate cyclo-ligase [Candidatus Omnitrophota bacterium]
MVTETINNNILREKQKLREEILKKLRSQDREELFKKSLLIEEKLFELEEFKKARCVIFYVSFGGEVHTHRMIDESIQMGKLVGVPCVIEGKEDLVISLITDRTRQLERGPLGIKQPKVGEIKPIQYEDMDLVVVPGVAFDANNNRLGRGKGYYDRFLKKLSHKTTTAGLCFDFQITESVPALPDDIPVRMLLSNA